MATNMEPAQINLLMLRVKSLRYFAFLSMEFDKKIVFDNPLSQYVEVSNNQFIYHLKTGDGLSTAVALTVHMILHLISFHTSRADYRDPDLWNVSCDHVVNTLIRRMASVMKPGICTLPKDAIQFPELAAEDPDAAAEQVYEILQENSQRVGQYSDKNTVQVRLPNGQTMNCPRDLTDNSNCDGNGSKARRHLDISDEKLQSLRDSANLLMLTESSNLKGDMDAHMLRYLERVFDIQIAWEEIFRQALLYYSKSPESRTWTRRNIYIPHYILPGYSDDCNTLNTLVISVDLSGSISDSDYAKFAAVVAESSQYYQRLVIITHEVNINEYIVLTNTNPEKVMQECAKFHGGGGTSHRAVFDKIEELYMSGEYEISSVVFLTDFYSDVEEIYSEYKFMEDITTVWLLPQDYTSYKEVSLPGVKTLSLPIRT